MAGSTTKIFAHGAPRGYSPGHIEGVAFNQMFEGKTTDAVWIALRLSGGSGAGHANERKGNCSERCLHFAEFVWMYCVRVDLRWKFGIRDS